MNVSQPVLFLPRIASNSSILVSGIDRVLKEPRSQTAEFHTSSNPTLANSAREWGTLDLEVRCENQNGRKAGPPVLGICRSKLGRFPKRRRTPDRSSHAGARLILGAHLRASPKNLLREFAPDRSNSANQSGQEKKQGAGLRRCDACQLQVEDRSARACYRVAA